MPKHLDAIRAAYEAADAAPSLFPKIDPDLEREAGMNGYLARLLQAARDLDARQDTPTPALSYEISNPASGAFLGRYSGADKAAALDAYARDAGYPDFRAACAVTGDDPDDDAGLVVREVDAPAPTPDHTPGPWSVSRSDNGIACIHDADGRHFANWRDLRNENDQANADRIAACVNACDGIADPVAALAAVEAAGFVVSLEVRSSQKSQLRLARGIDKSPRPHRLRVAF